MAAIFIAPPETNKMTSRSPSAREARSPPSYSSTDEETVSQSQKFADVMMSQAKHLALSECYEHEILRLAAQNDIATQSRSRVVEKKRFL
jgi:hypothetical protein